MGSEFTNDGSEKIQSGAIKYDGGKPSAYRGTIDYFPRAIEHVAAVSTFGASKYAWKGWEGVSEGFARYSDAMVRHLLAEGKGETTDPDSGLLHAAHAAWGALARLELLIRAQEKAKENAAALYEASWGPQEYTKWQQEQVGQLLPAGGAPQDHRIKHVSKDTADAHINRVARR